MNLFANLSHIFRGANGEPEVNRVVGAFGGFIYVVCAQVFVAWELILGRAFDLATYCLAFPGGLAVIVGGTAGAVALKDRNVATASVISETGSKPATPPAPAPPVQPGLGRPDDPQPTPGVYRPDQGSS